MKHLIYISMCVLFVSFTACKKINEKKDETKSSKDEIVETTKITHQLGTAEIIKNPKKVVALDYASLENLDELGIPVIGTAKSHLPQYLSKYKSDSITNLGTLFEVNFEALHQLEPDVIFISARMQRNYEELSKIAPTVYLTTDSKDMIGSINKNLSVFSKIFDTKDKTDKAFSTIQNKVDALKTKTSTSNKKALIIIHNNGKFSAFGKGSRFGIVHSLFGFEPAVKDLQKSRHGQPVSNEFIQQANPDYLFIVDRTAIVQKKPTDKSSIENVLIKQTNAYKNGKIIYLDPEVWYVSGDGITSFNMMIDEISANF